jgi:hypothetical protein
MEEVGTLSMSNEFGHLAHTCWSALSATKLARHQDFLHCSARCCCLLIQIWTSIVMPLTPVCFLQLLQGESSAGVNSEG